MNLRHFKAFILDAQIKEHPHRGVFENSCRFINKMYVY